MNPTLNNVNSVLASSTRFWRGTVAKKPVKRPEKPLQLFEFEACPYCRLVRETLTELDLDADIFPCPKGGKRFRPQAMGLGGKEQFPLLIDPNTDTVLLESEAIIGYLYGEYGGGSEPLWKALTRDQLTSTLATATRALRGMKARSSKAVEWNSAEPIELFSFESSPYSRKVRELLCELEIPYRLRNTGKVVLREIGPPWVRTKFFPNVPVLGPKRKELQARGGKLQVPYLVDPKTATALYESEAICEYLLAEYGV